MENAVLTVKVINAQTSEEITDADITVYDETEHMIIAGSDEWSIPVGHDYDITVQADGYDTITTDSATVEDSDPIMRIIALNEKLTAFATIEDYELQTGKTVDSNARPRVQKLLEDVSDLIREEGFAVSVDIDKQMTQRPSYATVVKMVTVDVVDRVMRQSGEGEPMSQESQSALGYSWSGTYAVAGGGVAMSLMNNELKRLGLKRPRIGSIQIWHI